MMPAAVVPFLPAIGGVVGGALGLVGQHKQAKAAEKGQREQLAYAREKETARRTKYDKALDVYRKNYQTWLSAYGNKGIKRYGMPEGIEVRPAGSRAAAAAAAGTAPGGVPRRPGIRAGAPAPGILPQRPIPADPNAGQGVRTLGNLLQSGVKAYGDYRTSRAAEFDPSKLRDQSRRPGGF